MFRAFFASLPPKVQAHGDAGAELREIQAYRGVGLESNRFYDVSETI